MMKELYVIDGTNLINVLSEGTQPDERRIGGLLQLLLAILERNETFFCYFDASTRFMLKEESIDRQMYDILIGLRIFDYFEQVKGGVQADKLILQQATDAQSKVISMDTFSQYFETYPWLEQEGEYRLIQADVIQGFLRVDKLGIKIELLEQQTKEMMLKVINILEAERGNLIGSIKKYDAARRFGLIQRAKGGPTLLFHKNQVVDEQLDYTISGLAVQFSIGFRFNKGKQKFDFCADNIKESDITITEEIITDIEQLKAIQDENKALKELVAGLKKRNRDLNNDRRILEADVQTKTAAIEVKESAYNDLEHKFLEYKQEQKEQEDKCRDEINRIRHERNELAITVDFQEQKIASLDNDLQETLRLFSNNKIDTTDLILYEQLKDNFKLLEAAVSKKEARIIFLRNNIQMLHSELEELESKDLVREVQLLKQKVLSLEKVNNALEQRLKNIAANDLKSIDSENHLSSLRQRDNSNIKVMTSDEDIENWWKGLSEEWQMAYNKAVLSRKENTSKPSNDILRQLLKTESVEIIGDRIFLGDYRQLSFKLLDMSGLKELQYLKHINLSGHDIVEIKELGLLHQLTSVNLTSNSIEHLNQQDADMVLKQVKTLILRDNLLQDLNGIAQFENLEFLDISNNEKLLSLEGLYHLKTLRTLKIGFAPKLKVEIARLQGIRPELEIKEI